MNGCILWGSRSRNSSTWSTNPYQGTHSKWVDVHMTTSATSKVTIEKLRNTFATLGLPKVLVSDNGTVQTLKRAMKKLTGSLETRLSRFLFNYRITPQSTTGVSPAELMFNRRLRSRFDLLYPDVSKGVQAKQILQQKSRSSVQGLRNFQPDNPVYCRHFSSTKPTWLPAVIKNKTGPLTYELKLTDEKIVRRHIDHIISRESNVDPPFDNFDDLDFSTSIPSAEQSSPSPNDKQMCPQNLHGEGGKCDIFQDSRTLSP